MAQDRKPNIDTMLVVGKSPCHSTGCVCLFLAEAG